MERRLESNKNKRIRKLLPTAGMASVRLSSFSISGLKLIVRKNFKLTIFESRTERMPATVVGNAVPRFK
jgi:hypothetical protein